MKGAYYRIEKNHAYDESRNTPWGQKERDKQKIEIYYSQRLKMTLKIGHYESKEQAVEFAELTCKVLNENTEWSSKESKYVQK